MIARSHERWRPLHHVDPAERPVLPHDPRRDRGPSRDARSRSHGDRDGRRDDRGRGPRLRRRRADGSGHHRDLLRPVGVGRHHGRDRERRRHARDRHDRPHLPDAPRRQDRAAQQVPAEDPRRPLDGVHARRRARLHGDRGGSRQGLPVHDQAQHRRGRDRRLGGARPRRHRPRRGAAGDGGQGRPVQGVRGRRRLPDLPRHAGPGRDRRDREGARARLRRHQPRGHHRAALLRDRGPARGRARHPGLPRRPARHRRRDAGGADQRRQADRPPTWPTCACS